MRRKIVPALLLSIAAAIGAAAFLRTRESVTPARLRTSEHAGGGQSPPAIKNSIPEPEVKSVLERLPSSDIPRQLQHNSHAEFPAAWAAWVSHHQAEVRNRLDRGDLDSIVNFWLYGTQFTALPRVTAEEIRKSRNPSAGEELMLNRLDEFVAALAEPGADERLRFAREVIARRGVNPSTPEGQARARVILALARNAMVDENRRYRTLLQSAAALEERARLDTYATAYHDRGLSSDTSLVVDFALDVALDALKSKGRIRPGSVRRVALIGPGLDFVDKAEGNDFYPPQTLQPFAVIDSLRRLELASAADLRVTTLDVSRRVNRHIEDARTRAEAGLPYDLHLPLEQRDPKHQWVPELVQWWKRLGATIGAELEPVRPRADLRLQIRTARVRPAVVLSVTPQDSNIVLERLVRPDADRFDLVIATNVLVYYGRFEQALALSNIASMLKPAGLLLTNYQLPVSAPFDAAAPLVTPVVIDTQRNGDTIFSYERAAPERR